MRKNPRVRFGILFPRFFLIACLSIACGVLNQITPPVSSNPTGRAEILPTSAYFETPREKPTDFPTSIEIPIESPTRELEPLPFPVAQQFGETSYFLKDVDFISAVTGWAVGEPHWDQALQAYTGTIVKTTDGGLTWKPQKAEIRETLRNVDFVDDSNGWAVGTNGTILHTTDGGNTWVRQSIDSQDEFRGVSFVNTKDGWASSFHATKQDDYTKQDTDWKGSVWHTGDGGTSWQRQALPEGASLMNRIKFIDSQEGWAVGIKKTGEVYAGNPVHAGVVYHTADGGNTWEELFSPEPQITFTAVDWIDKKTGWVAGFAMSSSVEGGCVFHTTDGGKTWQRQQPKCDVYAPVWDMQFIDANRGYIVGTNYVAAWGPPVYRTMDGGETWFNVRMEKENNEGLYGVSVVGDQVVVVGDHDILDKSVRGWDDAAKCPAGDSNGECLFTQSYLNPHYDFQDVFFTDKMTGWVVGNENLSPDMLGGQMILHTADGGTTWATQFEKAGGADSSGKGLENVFFTDSLNGWAVGASMGKHNAILHTADGGRTWVEQGQELMDMHDYDIELASVQFLNSQNGWVLAISNPMNSYDLSVAHTEDGGRHWNWVKTGFEGENLYAMVGIGGMLTFSDAQHGWAAGGRYELIATSDGGAHWSRQYLCGKECVAYVHAVRFLDDRNGWAAGDKLYHTTDGGQSWSTIDVQFDGEIQDIQFPSADIGWFVTDEGEIFYTNNGGLEWNPVGSDGYYPLKGLYFINPHQGWIVGEGGTILYVEGKT
jgi:photosystem II stability/assembly factor-like uncharacterized protein